MKRIGTTGNKTVIVEMTPVEWEWLEKDRIPSDDDPYKELRQRNLATLNLLRQGKEKTYELINRQIAEIVDEYVREAMSKAGLTQLRGQSLSPSIPVGNIE